MPEPVNIQVGGNVAGSIVVGDANFVVNTNYGNIVYQQARPQVRLRELAPQPPRAPRGFLNRTVELEKLAGWITSSEIIQLYGQDGVGKSALLRQAGNLAAKNFQNGVLFLENLETQADTWGADDVIQNLFDALFESEPPLKVDAVSGRTYLSNTKPLILFDEIPLSPKLQSILPDIFPQSALLMTTDIPVGADFQRLLVGPLPRAEAVNLLAARAGMELNETLRPVFNALCALLEDVSLAVILTGNIIQTTGTSPEDALRSLQAVPGGKPNLVSAALDRVYQFAFNLLTADEQKIISIAAQTPGVSMSSEWLSTALGANADHALERLKSLGLLFANSPRLRIPPGLLSAARRSSLLSEDTVIKNLVDYLLKNTASGAEFIQNETGNLLGALTWAVRKKQPEDVIALGRLLDAQACLTGTWDRWNQVLGLVLDASRETRNREVEAWALHQIGVREIGVGSRQQALTFLKQALEIRRSLGDRVGMAYTQHNINFLIAPPVLNRSDESQPRTPGRTGGLSGTLMAVIGLGVAGILLLAGLGAGLSLLFRPTATPQQIIPPPLDLTLTIIPGTSTPAARLSPSPTSTPIPTASLVPSPTISPTPTALGGSSGELIFQGAFSFETPEPYSLYILNPDHPEAKLVPVKPFFSIKEPVWSPDGKSIAFTSRNDSDFTDIFVALADGSKWRQITNNFSNSLDGNKSHPSWSPDGQRLIFLYTNPNQKTDIYVVDANGEGSNLKNLTSFADGTGQFAYPEWSPDGKRIAYQAFMDGGWEIFVMNADGSDPTQLTISDGSELSSIQPSWSPNAKQIAFASNRTGDWDIYKMDRKGQNVEALTQDGFYDITPDWSPDGRIIAFSSNRTDILQIFIMSDSGADLKQVSETKSEAAEPDWQP